MKGSQMSDVFQSILLKNGLLIRFLDESNRYYGDFHRVCIKVIVELPDTLDLPDELPGEELRYERRLEKMGVQTSELGVVRNNLINSFLASSRGYLEKSEFPHQLLDKLRQGRSARFF
jgi:hypothetical protein